MTSVWEDTRLKSGAGRLFAILCELDRAGTGKGCWARRETLGRLAAMSVNTVHTYLAALGRLDYVRIERRQRQVARIYVNPAAVAAAGLVARAEKSSPRPICTRVQIKKDSHDDDVMKARNPETRQAAPPAIEVAGPVVDEDLVVELQEAGVKNARRLVAAYPDGQIRRALEISGTKAELNRAGWIVSAITQGWNLVGARARPGPVDYGPTPGELDLSTLDLADVGAAVWGELA